MQLELLAPARNAAIAREAILHGADAVYIGGPSHGARASAANSVNDIASLTQYAHLFGVKVYVTLNTIIYDDELTQIERTIISLYEAGVDALIVQDMGILRLDIPPIDLHASTQCDIRTPQKARFLADCGFSQLVLPRELSFAEIKAVREALDADVRLEAFVHGALCVSYSGDCQASCLAKGRSANRGECAQMCRLPYSLVDGQGRVLMHDKHLLSLRDLNRLADIAALTEAGISSFKIEGRLKDVAYVKNVVSAYRRALDSVITASGGRHSRASWGDSLTTFVPDLDKTFNRGYTRYFIDGRPARPVSMANIDTPKWVGQRVGVVTKAAGKAIEARLDLSLSNGDGLGYYADGRYTGFRLNRIEGNRLYPATPVDIKAGTVLYRNRDVRFDAQMAQATATRLIGMSMSLDLADDGTLTLTLTDTNALSVSVADRIEPQRARTQQKAARSRALSRLGGTIYRLDKLVDNVDDTIFIPASTLNDLRQRAVAQHTKLLAANYVRIERCPESSTATWPHGTSLSYHDNVSNALSAAFYHEHGVADIQRAIECQSPADQGIRVMTTRYCIRRELGACLMEAGAKKLASPLYISGDTARYQLEFDCKNCQMHLLTAKKQR